MTKCLDLNIVLNANLYIINDNAIAFYFIFELPYSLENSMNENLIHICKFIRKQSSYQSDNQKKNNQLYLTN